MKYIAVGFIVWYIRIKGFFVLVCFGLFSGEGKIDREIPQLTVQSQQSTVPKGFWIKENGQPHDIDVTDLL